MSKRIAMVAACPYPVPQGSQVFLRDSALALQQRGHEVHLVVYGYGLGEDTSGLTVHRAANLSGATQTGAGPSWHKPLLDLMLLRTLRRVIREHRIDAVFAHNYEGLLVAWLARKRPLIYMAHNALADELPHYFNHVPWSKQLGKWLDRTLPRRADTVVAPHRRLAGYLALKGVASDQLAVIPPPLDATLFAPCAIDKKTLPPVLYTGNLDAYQNLDLLLEAMVLVRKEIPDARLVIATAEEAVIEGAEVIPTPDLAGLQAVLQQDAVVAIPRTSWSGYPIKLLNAMAAGHPIVACKSAAYPLTDGTNGVVVPDNDASAFAGALIELLQSYKRRANLGAAARQTVVEQHDPEHIGEQLEQLMGL